MAGFKTHIATSTVLGIGYGAAAHFRYGVPSINACWRPLVQRVGHAARPG